MSFKIGICGLVNSGKSYSRVTIPDGENCFLITPSLKATYLKTSKDQELKPFNVKTNSFGNLNEAITKVGVPGPISLLNKWNKELPAGTFKRENVTGNVYQVSDLSHMPAVMGFVSKHMPWIHTVIMPDFTHHISAQISDEGFISRKAGGEAYQKFWELAGTALRNFILSLDKYRDDLVFVTEYHAEFDEPSQSYDVYIPAGKMLKEKFKIPSYYDFLFFTDVKTHNEGEETEYAEYRFITKPTKKYPQARAMNIFETTYIPNDLHAVLTAVRKRLSIELPK